MQTSAKMADNTQVDTRAAGYLQSYRDGKYGVLAGARPVRMQGQAVQSSARTGVLYDAHGNLI